MNNQLSLYTPSNTNPEILEQILVQRHKLLDKSIQWCIESLTSSKKNHLLFIGPRGSGKTHMVSMIINRLKVKEELQDKMLIVWLGEDDIVTNFLDFVLYILRNLAKEYDFSLECLEEAKGLKADKAATIILDCINEQIKDRTILLVKENMSDVFNGLRDIGQKQFRAYLQEKKNMLVVGTSQQIFNGVASRDSVFFGFFDIYHLKPLSVADAMELIEKVSVLNEDNELRKFVNTAKGRYRVRALHHLAGGNQRLYMDLLNFLTMESLDSLVSALDRLADELTPYFQERIKSLAPQQGLIVQKLCEIEGAISVKSLAEEMFIGERSVAKQLGDLLKKGYVLAHKRGKQTYYEISEPLMRLSLQVKHTRGKPLKILVLLLRAWFTDDELETYERLKSDSLLREYVKSALVIDTTIIQKINDKSNKDLVKAIESDDENKVVEICSDIIVSPKINEAMEIERINALYLRGNADGRSKNFSLAINDFTSALPMVENNNEMKSDILLMRAFAYADNNEVNLAIKDYESILSYKNLEDETRSKTLFYYAGLLYEEKDYQRALEIMKQYIAFDNIPEKRKQQIFMDMADIYVELEEEEKGLNEYLNLLELKNLLIQQEDIFIQIILIYGVRSEYKKVVEYAKKLFSLKNLDPVIKSIAMYLYGITLLNQEEYIKGGKILKELLTLPETTIDTRMETLLLLTIVSYHNSEIKIAREYLSQWHEDAKGMSEVKSPTHLDNLLVSIAGCGRNIWKNEIGFVLQKIAEHKDMEYLAKALITSINYFIDTVDDLEQFKNWALAWEEIGKEYEYLEPALKVLNAAQLAVEQKSDKPLFILSKEMRELVLPMIEDSIKE